VNRLGEDAKYKWMKMQNTNTKQAGRCHRQAAFENSNSLAAELPT
jgi:hypothetical protein